MPNGVDWIVCDRCGELWQIGSPAPDPKRCPSCRAERMWRFLDRLPAFWQSETIKAKAAKCDSGAEAQPSLPGTAGLPL